jgi:hypothetical protein
MDTNLSVANAKTLFHYKLILLDVGLMPEEEVACAQKLKSYLQNFLASKKNAHRREIQRESFDAKMVFYSESLDLFLLESPTKGFVLASLEQISRK